MTIGQSEGLRCSGHRYSVINNTLNPPEKGPMLAPEGVSFPVVPKPRATIQKGKRPG